ncbi:hypothetical protein DPEC_G00125390 [Dallia pectoralis]|uniref:Uncharacterized protein n=1 Tax=Dallia pectoralis TaxID=75939 RepID=A0ACC2GQX5_DALPE|nr:hypothetical protein DPEC_G00125390 [Dallia pectoralis]
MMGNKLFGPCVCSLFVFHEAASFSIRNQLLGKCLGFLPDTNPGVGLDECRIGNERQEWQWLPEGQALSNKFTGECLSGHEHNHSVRLHRCGGDTEDVSENTGAMGVWKGQAWTCSRRSHLTLLGKGLLLTAHHMSSKVFLSEERGLASRWRTPGNLTVCGKRENHHHRFTLSAAQPVSTRDGVVVPTITEMDPESKLSHRPEITTPKGLSGTFFTTEDGFVWKVVMTVLSSMALVLGTVILMFNIYHNRKKRKPVCVLKSYIPVDVASQPGSPVSSERAPLMQNPMRPSHSPSLQHGDILIEWKDGTFTPLYNNSFLT